MSEEKIPVELQLLFKNQAFDDIGMHPAAIKHADGREEKRTEYGNGWNAGIMELLDKEITMREWYKGLTEEFKKPITDLLIADVLQINSDDKKIKLYLNANDTFYYSTAMGVEVTHNEVYNLAEAHMKYGEDGVLAWMSIKEGMLPLSQLVTPKFKKIYDEMTQNGKALV